MKKKVKIAAMLLTGGIIVGGCATQTHALAESKNIVLESTGATISNSTNTILAYAEKSVNLRSSNTKDSLKIDTLDENDVMYKIMSCDNSWDLVRYNGKIGYVCRDYIRYSDEYYQQEYEHLKQNDIVLTSTDLNFRLEPNQKADRITTFKKNTELQVLAMIDNGWLLVKNNGVIGYVHGDYTTSLLEKANELYPELNLSELSVKKVVYSNTQLNIRCGNSTKFDVIGQLEKYESVRVLGEYDDWYFVLTNDYNFGFISKEYTKDLTDSYVIVDKSEQRLYMYKNDELYYSTPVTTGKDTTPSDTGLFKIYAKETDRYLTDGKTYNSHVDYWMPYNGGEGLHDAKWRSVFGTESYHKSGSHGCVNIPPEIADDIYNNVEKGTKVLVHK